MTRLVCQEGTSRRWAREWPLSGAEEANDMRQQHVTLSARWSPSSAVSGTTEAATYSPDPPDRECVICRQPTIVAPQVPDERIVQVWASVSPRVGQGRSSSALGSYDFTPPRGPGSRRRS